MLTLVVLLSVIALGQGEYLRVCYYTNWAQYRPEPMTFFPEDIDIDLCTHFIFCFAWMDGNELTTFEWNDEEMYLRFNNHIHSANPSAKTLLGVGGWTFNVSELMTPMLATKENRAEFIDNVIRFLRDRHFDGFDLDYEYPGSRGSPLIDKYRFTKLVQEMRLAFDLEGIETGRDPLLLTAAVAIGKETIDRGYEIDKISKELDFINLMAYDLNGPWQPYTGHNSPLYGREDEPEGDETLNVDWGANYWIEGGCPPEKLVVGLALYGRGFNLTDTDQTGMGAPAEGECKPGKYTLSPGFMAYYEICPSLESGEATEVFHEEHQVPYAYLDITWIGYEHEESLRIKVRWMKEHGYGGIMFWAVDLDDFNGRQCAGFMGERYPLIHAANDELLNGSPMTTTAASTTTFSTTPLSTTISKATTTTQTTTTSTGVPTTTTSPGTVCGYRTVCGQEPSGRYPDPENCDGYYQCTSGVPTLVTCEGDTIFDPKQTKCDMAYNVEKNYICCKCPEENVGHPDGPC